MNPESSKITWPPAPPPPWMNHPLRMAAEGRSSKATAMVFIAFSLLLLGLSILIYWKKSWKIRSRMVQRRRELKIRRRLIPLIGDDAQWLSAREIQHRFTELQMDPDQWKTEIEQLELLELIRFSKPAQGWTAT